MGKIKLVHFVGFRLDAESFVLLQALCEQEGMKLSAVIRTCIREYAKRALNK